MRIILFIHTDSFTPKLVANQHFQMMKKLNKIWFTLVWFLRVYKLKTVAMSRCRNLGTLAFSLYLTLLLAQSYSPRTHLSQVTLHKSKESLMFHTIKATTVDVKQFKTKALPFLKIKVQGKHLGEVGIPTAGDHFSAVHLYDKCNTFTLTRKTLL